MKTFSEFIEDYKNGKVKRGLYSSKNENGEDLTILVEDKRGFDVYTNQRNGWVRVNYYDEVGECTGEAFDGKWN